MESLPQEIQYAICQAAVLMQAAQRRLPKWIGPFFAMGAKLAYYELRWPVWPWPRPWRRLPAPRSNNSARNCHMQTVIRGVRRVIRTSRRSKSPPQQDSGRLSLATYGPL